MKQGPNGHHEIFVELSDMCYRCKEPNGGYTGLDFGDMGRVISKIRFMPLIYNERIMKGGKFQGSNISEDTGYEDIYEIKTNPFNGWNEVIINSIKSFRFVRYLGPKGSQSIVARIEYYTCDTTNPKESDKTWTKLTGKPFGKIPLFEPCNGFDVPYKSHASKLSWKRIADSVGLPVLCTAANHQSTYYHTHDFLEILYIEKGSCFHIMNNQISCLFAGDLFIVPAGTSHTYFGGLNLEVINILVYNDIIPEKIRSNLSELPGMSCLFSDKPGFFIDGSHKIKTHLNSDQQRVVLPILEFMAYDSFSSRKGSLLSVFSYFIQFMYKLSSYNSDLEDIKKEKGQKNTKHQIVTGIINYLYENYSDIEKISELSDIFGLSYGRLTVIFNAETGMPILDYLNRIRIGIACQMLLEGSKSLTFIAYNVGYKSYTNFINYFKKYTGHSPLKLFDIMGIGTGGQVPCPS